MNSIRKQERAGWWIVPFWKRKAGAESWEKYLGLGWAEWQSLSGTSHSAASERWERKQAADIPLLVVSFKFCSRPMSNWDVQSCSAYLSASVSLCIFAGYNEITEWLPKEKKQLIVTGFLLYSLMHLFLHFSPSDATGRIGHSLLRPIETISWTNTFVDCSHPDERHMSRRWSHACVLQPCSAYCSVSGSVYVDFIFSWILQWDRV